MVTLLRKPQVLDSLGIKRSTLQNRINEGLFPPPIQIGGRSIAWTNQEVDTIVKSYIAGKTPDEIRFTVKQLVHQRHEVLGV